MQHPGEELPDYFVTSMSLSAEDHIRVQAAIQRWVDSSISKTANAPHDFTIEETKKLYELAFDLGCKGVTIYRDGSRDEQVLSTNARMRIRRLSSRRQKLEASEAPAASSDQVTAAEAEAFAGMTQAIASAFSDSGQTAEKYCERSIYETSASFARLDIQI